MALVDLKKIKGSCGGWRMGGQRGQHDEFATGSVERQGTGYWALGALPSIGVVGDGMPWMPLSSKTPSGCAGTGSGVEL